MPDALDQFGAGVFTHLPNHGISLFPVSGIDPDLDKLVVLKGRLQLLQYRQGQPVLANDDHRIEFVGEGTQVLFLFFGQCHRKWIPCMDKRQRSLTAIANSVTVPDSPLNPVKRELGWMLAVGLLLALVVGKLVPGAGAQLLLLSAYGTVGALRLVYRTRRILKQSAINKSKA